MRDELAVVGVAITSLELVRTTLNGVTTPWTVFVQGLVARENLHLRTGSVMTLFRRILAGVSYSEMVLIVGDMRRMWH